MRPAAGAACSGRNECQGCYLTFVHSLDIVSVL